MDGCARTAEYKRSALMSAVAEPGAITAGPDGNLWFTLNPAAAPPPPYAAGIGRIGPASTATIITRAASVSAHGKIEVTLACGTGCGRCASRSTLTAASLPTS